MDLVRGSQWGTMYFFSLTIQNVLSRKVRATLTGIAIAISIMTVVTMGVLTQSLRRTAISVLRTGTADFTVAEKGRSDVLYSSVDELQYRTIASYPEVESAVGVLVSFTKLDEEHPLFLRIGVEPDQLDEFGVQVIVGRMYEATAENEIMLGFRAARDLEKTVGDTMIISDDPFEIVGIYSTGQVFGDSAAMLPLQTQQARQRKPGIVTLVLVRVKEGADIEALRKRIEEDLPELATVRTESEFGRVDRNLELISAANVGVSILALAIGAISVMNTMMLTVFERTREFGVLRAIGWSRARVLGAVLSEAVIIALVGAMVGVGAGVVGVRLIERAPDVLGVFQPHYTSDVFARALAIAVGMAIVGAIYPAIRAAWLTPLTALQHE